MASCFFLIILIVWTVLQDKIFQAENYLVEKHLSYLKDKIKHNDILGTLFMSVIPKNGMCALGDSVCRRHNVILSKTSGFFFCNQAELPEIIFSPADGFLRNFSPLQRARTPRRVEDLWFICGFSSKKSSDSWHANISRILARFYRRAAEVSETY